MNVMRVAALVLVLRAVQFRPTPSAWGFEAHKFITEQMIALLPAELRPLFERKKAYLIERCVDPDLWRDRRMGDRGPASLRRSGLLRRLSVHRAAARVRSRGPEVRPRRRFTSRDCCRGGPRNSTAACSARSKASSVPSPSSYARDNIVLFSAILAHYVEDGHVPLHSIVNYDGFKTESERHPRPLGVRAVRAQSHAHCRQARGTESGSPTRASHHVRRAAGQQQAGGRRARGGSQSRGRARVLRRWLLRGVRDGAARRACSSGSTTRLLRWRR